jgi:4-diphosphocytidyl-2-C-methyl-D-erythritol kinase
MLIQRETTRVVVQAPAKVNLFLEVLARRSDGYHELASLMAAVSLFDILEFSEAPAPDLRLSCDHPALSTGPDNLVHRAASLLQERYGVKRGASIRLHKRIPMEAGLAGGSSDAAAALAGLSLLWGLGLDRASLAALGAELGSDVGFFFATPAAWCTGRGEVVEPLALRQPLYLVLVSPPFGLSTRAVYKALRVPEQPIDGTAAREAARAGDVPELGRRLHNRLQDAALALEPEVGRIHEALVRLRPAGALLSGSGSTLFALCRDVSEAWRIAREFPRTYRGPVERAAPRVQIVRSCS